MKHMSASEIELGLETVAAAPTQEGLVRLLVRRPGVDEREIVEEAQLDTRRGLVGDDWVNRPGLNSDRPSPFAQITLMNARYTALIAGSQERDWALAGDQLYIDMDISKSNLPPGARLAVGEAVLEVTPEPHTGCAKFSARFGSEALKATSTEHGREARLRGANAIVVESGSVRRGDIARKL
jgi:MOSC domain-containing protein YiiM